MQIFSPILNFPNSVINILSKGYNIYTSQPNAYLILEESRYLILVFLLTNLWE